MGWAWFFLVGREGLVGSSGVEAFSARAVASVNVGWPGGAAWIHGPGIFFCVDGSIEWIPLSMIVSFA